MSDVETPITEAVETPEIESVQSIMDASLADLAESETDDQTTEAVETTTVEGEGETEEVVTGIGGDKYTLSLEDNPVKSIADIAGLDNLNALKVDYTSDKGQKSLTIDELVRRDQKSVITDRVLERTTTQRDELLTELDDMKPEFERMKGNDGLLLKALNDEDFYRDLQKQVGAQPETSTPEPKTVEPTQPEAEVEVDDDAAQQAKVVAGESFAKEHLAPIVNQMAEAYGADSGEIMATILSEIGEVNPRFLTAEVVDEIVNIKMVETLIEAGYVSETELAAFNMGSFTEASGERKTVLTPKSEVETVEDRRTRLQAEIDVIDGKETKSDAAKTETETETVTKKANLPTGSQSDDTQAAGDAPEDADRQARYEKAIKDAKSVDEMKEAHRILLGTE